MPRPTQLVIAKGIALMTLAAALGGPAVAHRLVVSGDIWCQDGAIDFKDFRRVADRLGYVCDYDVDECKEDLNHNHVVDHSDTMIVAAHMGKSCLHADVNGDQDEDLSDVIAAIGAMGTDCSADLDRDGEVTVLDRLHVQAAFDSTVDPHSHPRATRLAGDLCAIGADDVIAAVHAIGTDCRADVNHDGTIDCHDVNTICEAVGLCPPVVMACAPEPVAPECP